LQRVALFFGLQPSHSLFKRAALGPLIRNGRKGAPLRLRKRANIRAQRFE
jgi:hypothetical protein